MISKEVEIRYRLSSEQQSSLLEALQRLGWSSEQSIQFDTYLCAKEYVDSGRTRECPYIVRVRVSDSSAKLAYKSFKGADGTSWVELEAKVESPETIMAILEHLGQVPYLEIHKTRLSGKIDGVEINLDEIDRLGKFVEFELVTDNEGAGRRQLVDLAARLGLSEDKVVTTGYVQLVERAQAAR